MPKQLNAMGLMSSDPCPIPGCADLRLKDSPVCLVHSVEIWQHVQSVKGNPLIYDTMVESVAQRERRMDDAERKRIEFNKTRGTIYYIRVDDKIKIGWSANLPQRLRSYPPHMVLLTDHPGTRADERDLHRSFKPSRASGREWYHPTQEVLAHIERAKVTEAQRQADVHMARLSAAADEEAAMNAAWPGSSLLRMYRDDPLSTA